MPFVKTNVPITLLSFESANDVWGILMPLCSSRSHSDLGEPLRSLGEPQIPTTLRTLLEARLVENPHSLLLVAAELELVGQDSSILSILAILTLCRHRCCRLSPHSCPLLRHLRHPLLTWALPPLPELHRHGWPRRCNSGVLTHGPFYARLGLLPPIHH